LGSCDCFPSVKPGELAVNTPVEPVPPPARSAHLKPAAWVVAGSILAWTVLSFQGFCLTQLRFASDQELIASAVKSLAADGVMLIEPSDSAVADFLRDHPTCCSIDRHPASRNALDVITGWNYSEVEINFEASAQRAAAARARYYKQWMRVDACGNVLTYPAGTGTSTLETAQ
jgi:hypothetical protein